MRFHVTPMIIVVLICLMRILGIADDSHWTFEASLSNGSIPAGAPIELKLSTLYKGKQAIKLLEASDLLRLVKFTIMRDNVPIEYPKWRDDPLFKLYAPLYQPSKAVTRSVNLSVLADFSQPGSYTIDVSRRIIPDDRGASPLALEKPLTLTAKTKFTVNRLPAPLSAEVADDGIRLKAFLAKAPEFRPDEVLLVVEIIADKAEKRRVPIGGKFFNDYSVEVFLEGRLVLPTIPNWRDVVSEEIGANGSRKLQTGESDEKHFNLARIYDFQNVGHYYIRVGRRAADVPKTKEGNQNSYKRAAVGFTISEKQ